MSLKVHFCPRVSLLLYADAPLKQEIDVNVAALKAYDAGEYEVALKKFQVLSFTVGLSG
jgi:hypothetical protein